MTSPKLKLLFAFSCVQAKDVVNVFGAGCSEICARHLVQAFFLKNQPGTMELMVMNSLQQRLFYFLHFEDFTNNVGLQDMPTLHHYQSHVAYKQVY